MSELMMAELMKDFNDVYDIALEPVLNDVNETRFTMANINYPDLFNLYKKQLACFWVVEEISLNRDIRDWIEHLNDNERHFIKMILGFFAASDGIVCENLIERFMQDVKIVEARCFYSAQMLIENIHQETYALFLKTFVENEQERDLYFNAIRNIPSIQRKANWTKSWINDSQPFVYRLIAFTIVEGLFFSGSFAAIFWLKKRGILPGLTFSNELISRDEALHCEFAITLMRHLNQLPARETVIYMLVDAVNIEKEFMNDALRIDLIGMNKREMGNYIEFVADRLLIQMNYGMHYGTVNPFDFMNMISLEGKTNFFERKVSEYKKFNPNAEQRDDFDESQAFNSDF